MNAKALLAEFIGTFALIFIGIGAGNAVFKGDLTGVAFAHGIAIAVMVSAFGAISGGHFNPSVSFGVWLGHRISTLTLILYWIAQVAGGVFGAWLLYYCMPEAMGTPSLAPEVNMTQGFILEAVGAFFLTTVVYGTAVDKRAPKVGGLFIGLTVTMAILCFGTKTGGSINPARFLGPAIVGKHFENLLVYLFAPLVGGGVAGVLYNYFFMEKEQPEPVGPQALAPEAAAV